MTDDDINPVSDVERLLTHGETRGLSEDTKNRHRSMLRQTIAADTTVAVASLSARRVTRRRRRRRMLTSAGVGAALIATGGGLAVARLTHDRPDVTNVIRCFAIPTTSYDDLTLGVDASYYATPSGGTARTAAMALDVCGSMWARGELSQRAPYITNTLDETSSHPVPELQACVLPAGNVGVFPGATACDHLGLPVPDL